MDFNQIKKVAGALSKLIEDNEKIALAIFANKLAKASEIYPEDKTIGTMADVVARMGTKKNFITKAEIRDLYNRLHSRNTKFPELFKDELGQTEKLAGAKLYSRHDDEGFDLLKKAYDQVVDPTLSNALNVAFGNETKGYTDTAAENAKNVCVRWCAATKLASKVDVVNGNENFIVCRVAFETPKGQTSIFVPVEISAGKVLQPSIFIGNNGPTDLSKTSVEKYIAANAGSKLNVSEKVVFQAIDNVKSGGIDKVSSVDIALTKVNSLKEEKSEYFTNGVFYQKIEAENNNLTVKTPAYKDDEVDSFAKKFDSALGVANFKFGDKVKLGRATIANKLASLGLTNPQIAVCDSDKTSIVYAVSLNGGRFAFRVPVRVQDNKIIDPALLISNGAVESFSKDGLTALMKKEATDYRTAAVASPLYGLKASELVQIMREAMLEQNFAKAEDTLNVIAETGDDKAYQTAFVVYTNGLNGAQASNQCKCSMVVKNSSSKHPICGHTGLPLHKVYQDQNGDCHPLYRKGMEDTKEGAYFLNSKIFF